MYVEVHTCIDDVLSHTETKQFSFDSFPEGFSSVFLGCKVETITLNVEAVNTHRDKPTVSIVPWTQVPGFYHLEPLNLWHQDTEVSFMYQRKRDSELMPM